MLQEPTDISIPAGSRLLVWRGYTRSGSKKYWDNFRPIASLQVIYSTKILYSVTYVSIVYVLGRSLLIVYTSVCPVVYKLSTDTSRSSHLFRKAQYYEKSRSKKCLDNFRQTAFIPNCFKNLKFGYLRQYYVKSLHSDVHHSPECRVNAALFSQRLCDSQAMMVISVHTND